MYFRLTDALITYADGKMVLEEIKPLALLTRPHKGREKLLAKMNAGQAHADQQGWDWRITHYPEGRCTIG